MTDQFKTPMMQQYLKIKEEYPDCLLFFRMGDFYELFLDDAIIGAEILDIALTARSKGSDGKIPMCGVPYHSVDAYLSKIIKAGRKAAICEQTSKPKPGNELVERRVVRIVTPGTLVDDALLENKSNNFLLTFLVFQTRIYFAYADISTGEFTVFNKPHIGNAENINSVIANEIKRISPSEIVLSAKLYNDFDLLNHIHNVSGSNIFPYDKADNQTPDDAVHHIKQFFNIKNMNSFGIDETDYETIKAASILLSYIQNNLKEQIGHIKCIKTANSNEFLRLDSETLGNLEIFESNRIGASRTQKLSLFSVLNSTETSMGERLLRNWLLFPLVNLKSIQNRQNAIGDFIKNKIALRDTSEILKQISDIERIVSRIGTNRGNARDLLNLSSSLKAINALNKVACDLPNIKNLLSTHNYKNVEILDVINLIDKNIRTDAPVSIREGSLINSGCNETLDQLKNAISGSKDWIASLENKEREKTGINNLKVGFNSVFGYYIEITKSNLANVPENYIRKQTLVNAERYITQELKEKEDIVLSAEEKIYELEYEIFQEITKKIISSIEIIQIAAQITAIVDIIASFAKNAFEKNYICPHLLESSENLFDVKEGRHPVVESTLPSGEFTPNSTLMNGKEFIHLITGPNMAGKSTYIRQIALLQLMSQIGSYIPAFSAKISLVDAIYTRIGAGDALAQGLSTFMVEMIETAKILNNATQKSLIILDEVGRGTSTVDGLSIAKAVVEHLHNTIKAKTLFATHFHELINLGQKLKNIANYHVRVNEENNQIKFLHKVEKGGTDKSYGIEVARLAGLPEEVLARAKFLLNSNSEKQLKLEF